MGGRSDNKAGYFDKLKGLLDEFKSIFIVTVDNVSSQQMHEIRLALRGKGVVLMGKNTMVCLCECLYPRGGVPTLRRA
jgi:large subunit ribosomal protein LP0